MTWDVSNYNTNPALNTGINGTDISEGSAAAGYNNALRQIMADIKAWTDGYAVTYPIAVNKGGTGAITASAALDAIGGKALAQSAKSAAFSFDLTQKGGHVYYTGGAANATIEPDATTSFPVGSTILVVNNGSGALTFVRGAGVTLKWASTGANADRILAAGGMATLLNVAANVWFITGTQVS